MKTKAIIFMLTLAASMVSGCCDRRCGIARLKSPELESEIVKEKLVKMKEQAGGKGYK